MVIKTNYCKGDYIETRDCEGYYKVIVFKGNKVQTDKGDFDIDKMKNYNFSDREYEIDTTPENVGGFYVGQRVAYTGFGREYTTIQSIDQYSNTVTVLDGWGDEEVLSADQFEGAISQPAGN